MTTEEWDKKWQEGMDSIEASSVRLERMRHSLNVIEQKLDELDARPTRRTLFGLFKEKK